MRAVSGAILTLAGAVFAQMGRNDYLFEYPIVLFGLALFAYG